MKRTFILLLAGAMALQMAAQMDRRVQNKPYIDLRPMHFGILIGLNMQDLEVENTGPYMTVAEDGTMQEQYVLCEADQWSPGFSVGVLGELRLSDNFSLRLTPTMHFGAKHLTFLNMNVKDADGQPLRQSQDMKNTYISVPLDIKFAAPRWNNHRPYVMAGVNPMFNLTSGNQDMVRLKRFDTMLEIGMGCDFYLPFFKLIPELKFCFGLKNALDTKHAEELNDANLRPYANSVNYARSNMVVLTFYFE